MTERNGTDDDATDPDTAPDEHVLVHAEGLDLPAEAIATLRAGIPADLRIMGWPGPGLFHSELASGTLLSTTHEDAILRRVGEHEGYIFGSVRQTPTSAPFSAFVLRRHVGDVWLMDAGDPLMDCFANVSLDAFMASLLAFHGAFDHLLAHGGDREAHVASFRALLEKIDAKSIELPEHYWPGWLEAMQ